MSNVKTQLKYLDTSNVISFDHDIIVENLKNMGVEVLNIPEKSSSIQFKYSEDFDWGELSYEDKITIEREIVNENVYRFWKDVNENDVVLDIGASVGAYTISILDQKPKKVY